MSGGFVMSRTFHRAVCGLVAVLAAPMVSVPVAAAAAVAPAPSAMPAPTLAAVAPARQHLVFADDLGSGVLDAMMEYGNFGETVLTGDWDGDGKDGVAVRRGNRYFFRNSLTSGAATLTVNIGEASDQVLVGDWNGDGKDTLAIKRGRTFYFRNSLTSSANAATFSWGRSSDTFLVGDWDGNGKDTLGIKRGNEYRLRNLLSAGDVNVVMRYGNGNEKPLPGDWDGNGRDSIAVRSGTTIYIRNLLTTGSSQVRRTWGSASDRILVGDWNGDGIDKVGAARTYNSKYRVWELTNSRRAQAGRSKLKYSTCLQDKYSQPWSQRMASTSNFAHQSLGRRLCSSDALAENIAAGYGTAEAVMNGWMGSAGHRANILATGRTVMSVGVATTTRSSDPYKTYWTQNFG